MCVCVLFAASKTRRVATMLLLAFRSFFFIAVILGYSTGIWRLINDYFRREFQTYLVEESQTNKYLLRDPPKPEPPEATDKQQDDHQQVTDSIRALFETVSTEAGTDAGANFVANDANAAPGTQRPGDQALRVAAAEVTDIRPRDAAQGNKLEGDGEGEAEDKWIVYWSGRGRKRDEGEDDSANAYCTPISARTSGETLAGAVTRITERLMPDGEDFGCPG